jgi:hypothetical protein
LKVLIDECIDWRLGRDITGHEVKTARQMGWSSVKNGELLALAEEEFDVFVSRSKLNLSAKTSRFQYSGNRHARSLQ